MKPRIAIPKFPGSNGETDNLRCLQRCGFDAFVFRWNDSREKLEGVEGYFFGAGFSYEDRGRAGMVAARDPLFEFIGKEAEEGKVVIGNCNGAQVLVESGMIPMGDGLRMCLARNAIRCAEIPNPKFQIPNKSQIQNSKSQTWHAPGFLNQWVYITRTCRRNRCATSDWDGVMQVPIAHGEGRFVTTDAGLIEVLQENDQIAFCYCDSTGKVSADPPITPNGSMRGIAGICNPRGNVVALMPHPERTRNGDPYFLSIQHWLRQKERVRKSQIPISKSQISPNFQIPNREPRDVEIFIDTLIVNNEERTVEQAAKRIVPALRLKQFRYIAPASKKAEEILSHISVFNPNKERAYVRSGSGSESGSARWFRWNAEKKILEACASLGGFRSDSEPQPEPVVLLRRDIPDTGASSFGEGSETGVCYALRGIREADLANSRLLEIFGNPHASILEVLLAGGQA
jgi:phosphoribosylformylglycinamidine synthase